MRLTLFIVAVSALAQTRTVTDAEVMRVHKSALLIDTHNDITSRTVEGLDLANENPPPPATHTTIQRLKQGGVGATFFAVYVSGDYVKDNHSANRTLQMIDTVRHDIIAKHPNDFVFATTAAQIEAAHKQGKMAALMGIEGGHAIEDSLRLLRDYYALGVRYMTLTHSNTNNWADSSGDVTKTDVKHHNGLTDFGKDVVREMNRLGMMIDISHVADKTFFDALDVSKAPIMASHSSARALANVPRNMTDEMLVAIAKKGGVVQVNFNCGFLVAGSTATNNRAKLSDVVAHIDHIKKVAGINAIGIGSDFDGITCTPEGLDDVSKFPNLTRALLERNYSADDIKKIYGGNILRVMRATEAAAGK